MPLSLCLLVEVPGAEINPYAIVIYFRVANSPTFLHHTLKKLPLMAGIKNRTMSQVHTKY